MLKLFEVMNLKTLCATFLWLSLFTNNAYQNYSGQNLLYLLNLPVEQGINNSRENVAHILWNFYVMLLVTAECYSL